MYQGQTCWIETRSNAPDDYVKLSGWFQKLRSDDGNGVFYYQLGSDFKLAVDAVDDSMLNKSPERHYEVVMVVPAELQAKHTKIDDEIVKSICLREILQEIKRMDKVYHEKAEQLAKLDALRKEAESILSQRTELTKAYDEAMRNGGVPKFYYAYGKHDADGKEYCWRVPFGLRDLVQPGATVMVEARDGIKSCVVTRVQISPQLFHHKKVAAVAQKSA